MSGGDGWISEPSTVWNIYDLSRFKGWKIDVFSLKPNLPIEKKCADRNLFVNHSKSSLPIPSSLGFQTPNVRFGTWMSQEIKNG